MDNLELYKKLKEVPNEAKKTIGGGRLKGFTDINPMWRLKKLTEVFGACGFGWYYEVTKQELIEGKDGEIACFVNINLFIRNDDKTWNKAIPGFGGSMFVSKEKNGFYTSDECYKMALTDAIGTAAKSLGLAADVYYEKDRTKYDQAQKQTPETKQKVKKNFPKNSEYFNKCVVFLKNGGTIDALKSEWIIDQQTEANLISASES